MPFKCNLQRYTAGADIVHVTCGTCREVEQREKKARNRESNDK